MKCTPCRLWGRSARKQHCHKTYQLFGSLSLHHKEQEAAGRPPGCTQERQQAQPLCRRLLRGAQRPGGPILARKDSSERLSGCAPLSAAIWGQRVSASQVQHLGSICWSPAKCEAVYPGHTLLRGGRLPVKSKEAPTLILLR